MAKRIVDKRKTAKVLRKLRKAVERAGSEGTPDLTNWEKDFVEGVTKRLETYGSAFRDPGKGRLEEALSQRQQHVARVIDKKSRPKAAGKTKAKDDKAPGFKGSSFKGSSFKGSSFKRKSPMRSKGTPYRGPRVRDINDDPDPDPGPAPAPAQKRASLRVIEGGNSGKKAR
jgi:hypothetical protein